MSADPNSRRPFFRFDSTGDREKRQLLKHARHLPLIGRTSALDKLPPEYRARLESVDGRPYKITLWIKRSEEEDKFYPATFFARGRDPEKAIARAERWWSVLVKVRAGIQHLRYPEALGRGHCTVLDEGDWAEYYRDAKRYGGKANLTMEVIGDIEHPFMFTVLGMVFDIEAHQQPNDLDWDSLTTIRKID